MVTMTRMGHNVECRVMREGDEVALVLYLPQPHDFYMSKEEALKLSAAVATTLAEMP